MLSADIKVSPDWTVNDVMRCVPSSIGVLNGFGIDTCCGGVDTLDVAAGNSSVSVDQLVYELNLCIRIYEPLKDADSASLARSCAHDSAVNKKRSMAQ